MQLLTCLLFTVRETAFILVVANHGIFSIRIKNKKFFIVSILLKIKTPFIWLRKKAKKGFFATMNPIVSIGQLPEISMLMHAAPTAFQSRPLDRGYPMHN